MCTEKFLLTPKMKHFIFGHVVKAKEIKRLNFIKEEMVFSPFSFSSQYARDKNFGFLRSLKLLSPFSGDAMNHSSA